ncbi:MAG: zinc transporter ZntB [Rhodospirillales bacterium]|nr:zinc transporter ZntB [Rhodospirillales bacterium]
MEHAELVCAYRLDGTGRGQRIEWDEMISWVPGKDLIWIHLDGTHAGTEAWFRTHSGLNTFNIDGMLASETRPRCTWHEDGIQLNLRGVNLNPGAVPEDLVSIRIWIEKNRVISLKHRKLLAINDIREQLESGKGPISTGHLVARLASRLTDRMGPVIAEVSDKIAELEEILIEDDTDKQANLRDVRHELVGFRRSTISLRRYIAPQRDALHKLVEMDHDWFDENMLGRLRETVDQVTRITESLDEIRERSAVVQDELMNRISQRMERTMYVLTMVATIMLPLGFLTGLLGINVGGIPGAEVNWAFWAVCGGLAVVVVVEYWLFKRLKWL